MAGAWDPEYVNYLAAEPMYPGVPSYEEDEFDYQGDWMTEAKKGATLGADISYALMNNLLDPRVFQPISSYEPVDARGHRTLEKWKQGTPYQQYVADRFDQGWGSGQIRSELENWAADPTTFTQEDGSPGDPEVLSAILGDLPRYYARDPNNPDSPITRTTQPDFDRVDDDLQNLEGMIQSDPQFDIIDENGNPVKVTSEDSPMTKKARALGYYNTPDQMYDPWEFAPEGVTPETDAALEVARRKAATDMAWQGGVALPEAIKDRDAQAERYRRFLDVQKPGGRSVADFKVAPSPGGGSGGGFVRNIPQVTDETGNESTGFVRNRIVSPEINPNPNKGFVRNRPQVATPGALGMKRASGRAPVNDPSILAGIIAQQKRKAGEAQARVVKGNLANVAAKKANLVASARAFDARRQQQERQALVQYLAANGRTPFTAEVNARRGGVYGGI